MISHLPLLHKYLSYLLIFVISLSTIVRSENVNVTITLNKTLTLDNKELYGDFHSINSGSTIQVKLLIVTKVSYVIFQVHSHTYNITLSYNNTLTKHFYINGTNVGLYSPAVAPDMFYISNPNNKTLKLYISVHGYRHLDPIPGGCNTEYPVEISPFMNVEYNKDFIRVDAALPKLLTSPECPITYDVDVKIYRMYLTERKYDTDTYFDGIKNMMTKEKIKKYGEEIPQNANKIIYKPILQRLLGAYPGTGSIYVAMAYWRLNESRYSLYVPSYTYACSPQDEGCEVLDDVLSEFLCAILFFIGIFTCYFGHRFFKTEMFLVGTFTGVIITYILIPLISDLERPALLGAAVISGVFFGAIWLLFWWMYGIPVAAVLLSTLHLGFLTSAIIYYGLPGGLALIEEDGSFWTLFIIVMLLMSLTLVSATFLSNLLCCAVLGAYATAFSLDHYIGSNLKYILINTVRRAVVKNYCLVVVSPPFQLRDAITTVLWVALATSGFLFQRYHNRGRPPFPPPPRSISARMPEPPSYGAIGHGGRRYGGVEDGADSSTLPTNAAAADERAPLLANYS